MIMTYKFYDGGELEIMFNHGENELTIFCQGESSEAEYSFQSQEEVDEFINVLKKLKQKFE